MGVNLFGDLGNFLRLQIACFVDQSVEPIHQLFFFLDVTSQAVVEQFALAERGQLFFPLPVDFVFQRSLVTGLFQGRLQLADQLGPLGGIQVGSPSDAFQRKFQILNGHPWVARHGRAGVDHRVFNFLGNHLGNHAALLLYLIEQRGATAHPV